MRPIPTPNILGTDVAGTVVQLGRKVTRFHVGQRVFGYEVLLLYYIYPLHHLTLHISVYATA